MADVLASGRDLSRAETVPAARVELSGRKKAVASSPCQFSPGAGANQRAGIQARRPSDTAHFQSLEPRLMLHAAFSPANCNPTPQAVPGSEADNPSPKFDRRISGQSRCSPAVTRSSLPLWDLGATPSAPGSGNWGPLRKLTYSVATYKLRTLGRRDVYDSDAPPLFRPLSRYHSPSSHRRFLFLSQPEDVVPRVGSTPQREACCFSRGQNRRRLCPPRRWQEGEGGVQCTFWPSERTCLWSAWESGLLTRVPRPNSSPRSRRPTSSPGARSRSISIVSKPTHQ